MTRGRHRSGPAADRQSGTAANRSVPTPEQCPRPAHFLSGDHSGDLATIAAKNHRNGVKNPLAHLRKDFGFDFCNTVSDKNPIVAEPLRVTDCSPISDGATALILVADEVATEFDRAVTFRSMAHVQDLLPMSQRNLLAFEGPARAFDTAFSAAGINVMDLASPRCPTASRSPSCCATKR